MVVPTFKESMSICKVQINFFRVMGYLHRTHVKLFKSGPIL
ncbi:conserved hypothetical protein [Leptospira interrogans serovar Manilae]|uniref:Uncharacterized protein n=1 Tax=Leptospira interrogans serovar Manilae TaxID=214675 RepID=A0AAQ1NXM7_LEPIR|nr:conserved hypothetical protein [Leptospira interrogans serovar Manilae]